jgi:hypothetical protein
MNILSKLKVGGLIIGIVLVITVMIVLTQGLGKNDDQNYQIKQSITGKVEIIDRPGWYVKMFATVWTYPRAVQKYFSKSTDEGGTKDESIRGTFNDSGTADFSTMIRYQTPITEERRRKAHRDFSGNVDNMTHSVRAHLINCIKNTAPLMSASEHQSARKAEFTQLIHSQLENGLYEMKKVEKVLKDRFDEKGNPITVYATEIVPDEKGMPKISSPSPLDEYGLKILQFSITGTQYDDQILAQFAAKKESYLLAEKSKAQREQEVQERLMIEEKGKKEIVEIEIEANKVKKKATIEAEQKVAVAEQAALQALQAKKKAETEAAQLVEVAKLKLEAANLDAQAVTVLAEAEETRIQKAGAFTEKDKGLAEIAAKRDAMVAAELSKIPVPGVVIGGGNGNSDGTMGSLINMLLMKQSGILDPGNVSVKKAITEPISLPVVPSGKK